MSRDGAFSSRRGTGEGLLPTPSELILPCSFRAAQLSRCTFRPNASANCGATQLTPNDRRGAWGAAASSVQHSAAHAAWKTGLWIFAVLNVYGPSSLRGEAGSADLFFRSAAFGPWMMEQPQTLENRSALPAFPSRGVAQTLVCMSAPQMPQGALSSVAQT